MATHTSVLAWRIPGTGEPGGLPSIGSQSQTRLKRLSSSSRYEICIHIGIHTHTHTHTEAWAEQTNTLIKTFSVSHGARLGHEIICNFCLLTLFKIVYMSYRC